MKEYMLFNRNQKTGRDKDEKNIRKRSFSDITKFIDLDFRFFHCKYRSMDYNCKITINDIIH